MHLGLPWTRPGFHAPLYLFVAKSHSFIKGLEAREKSGELNKKGGRKVLGRRNCFIDNEAESSDENKYKSGSVEDHRGSDQEEDIRSNKRNLKRGHPHASDDNNEDSIYSSRDNNEGRDLSSLMGNASGHQDLVHVCALLLLQA